MDEGWRTPLTAARREGICLHSLPVRSCAKQVISGTIEFIIRQIYVFIEG